MILGLSKTTILALTLFQSSIADLRVVVAENTIREVVYLDFVLKRWQPSFYLPYSWVQGMCKEVISIEKERADTYVTNQNY